MGAVVGILTFIILAIGSLLTYRNSKSYREEEASEHETEKCQGDQAPQQHHRPHHPGHSGGDLDVPGPVGHPDSFRGEKGSYVSTFFPKTYTLDNYIKLFTDTTILNFPQMFLNTLIIAIFSCLLSSFFVLSASFCLSRLRFKLRKPYMNMAMILGLFPGFMSMVAVYFILKAVGLTEGNNVRIALILCYSGGAALGFQIIKGFFDTMPKELDEAASSTAAPGGRSYPHHAAAVQAHHHLPDFDLLHRALGWTSSLPRSSAGPTPTSTRWPSACGACWRRNTSTTGTPALPPARC